MTAVPDETINVTQELADNINNNVDTICIDLSKKFNLNVLFANKIGSFTSTVPIGDYIMKTTYCGLTKIIKSGGIVEENYKAKDEDFNDYNGEVVIGNINISNIDQMYKGDEYKIISSEMYGTLCKTNDENKKYQAIQKFIGYIYYNCSIKRRLSAARIYDGSVVPYLFKSFLNYSFVYVVYKLYKRNKV